MDVVMAEDKILPLKYLEPFNKLRSVTSQKTGLIYTSLGYTFRFHVGSYEYKILPSGSIVGFFVRCDGLFVSVEQPIYGLVTQGKPFTT
jgi:hypothetical protein